jgi:hypothetical protein
MAIKLGAGYLELDIQYTDAMKKIADDLAAMQKTSKSVGDAVGKNISKPMDDVAKAIDTAAKSSKDLGKELASARKPIDEAVKSATNLGKQLDESKKKATDVGKGLQTGVEAGAKSAQTAIASAAKRGGDTLANSIINSVNKGAKEAGIDLNQEIGKAANSVGQKIHDAIMGSVAGDMFHSLRDGIDRTVDGVNHIRDAFQGIKNHDPTAALNGAAGALRDIGQGNAAAALNRVSTEIQNVNTNFQNTKGAIDGVTNTLGAAVPKWKSGLGEVSNIAAGLLTALQEFDHLTDPNSGVGKNMHDWMVRNHLLPGETPGGPPGAGQPPPGHLVVPTPGQQTPTSKIKDFFGFGSPAPPAPTGMSPFRNTWQQDAFKDMLVPPQFRPPGMASGGVTPAGRIFGPGTGTSDSIIGIDAMGLPTAMVSKGEGVVKTAAMENGGAALVAALNAGQPPADLLAGLPRYDDGNPPGLDPNMMRLLAAMQQGRIGPQGQLGPGVGNEGGLQSNTIRGERLLSAMFPELTTIGGFDQRPPGTPQWHTKGLALDVMIPGWNTPQGKALGDQVNAFIRANAGALGSDYTMWQEPDHYNHIHANFAPSGYPGKDAQYGLPPQLAAMLGAGGKGGQSALAGLMPAAPAGFNPFAGLPGMGGRGGGPSLSAAGQPGNTAQRTQGFIPAGAGASGQSGSSLASGAIMLGAGAINYGIDTAFSMAQQAIQMGISAASAAGAAGSGGAGAASPAGGMAASAAANFGLGIANQEAKLGVNYGFQMLGIAADAIPEILLPFGVPRWFQTDPQQFIPQLPNLPAAQTTGEKSQTPGGQPGGPVQPGQVPGMQPLGQPVKQQQPGQPGPAISAIPQAMGKIGESAGKPQLPNMPPPGAAPAPQNVVPQPSQPAPGDPFYSLPITPYGNGGPVPFVGKNSGGTMLLPPGVYDEGGWLMPNQPAINLTKTPEPVFNSRQFDNIAAIANRPVSEYDPSSGGGTYAPDFSVHMPGVVVKDVEELSQKIKDRQQLAMMRYAARPSVRLS